MTVAATGVAGFLLGAVLVAALGRRADVLRLTWHVSLSREPPPEPLRGPQSDETGPGGMATAEGDQGERGGPWPGPTGAGSAPG